MSFSVNSAKVANIYDEDSYVSQDDSDNSEVDSNYRVDKEDNEARYNLQERIEPEVPPITLRMLNLCREFAIFCLIMVTLTALTRDPPKVSKPPAAYPFFSKNSMVTDWYRGHVSRAIEYSRSNDIAFIMFYAPWDAESQAARKEFETAAKYMQDYISFSAVNCWHPQSECRIQYSKVYRWPILIAYPSHGRGVQYNGPLNAPHMIQFLKKVCKPIVRISDDKPKDFEDVYVIAEVNTSPGSLEYAVFYTAALNYLEKDPQHRITFFVNPKRSELPSLRLYLWNETLIFPSHERTWSPEEILKWIFKHTRQTTAWIIPKGSKSLSLSNHLNNSPAFILFTPKNPLHFGTDYYMMLQEAAQEYFNCKDNVVVDMHSVALTLKRSVNLLRYKTLKATCGAKPNVENRRVISTLATAWSNVSTCSKKMDRDCNFLDKINTFCSDWQSKGYIDLASLVSMGSDEGCNSYKASGRLENYSSMYTGHNDPRSPGNLLKLYHKEKCKQFLAAERLHPALFANEQVHAGKVENISGLASQTNKTLTFLTMDSLLNYNFAQRLGVDVLKKFDKSAAVIINDRMESHYILEGPINGRTIREFIYNYTKDRLSRSLESPVELIDTRRGIGKDYVDTRDIRIQELNSKNFLPTILEENKAVIVFYYSKQCSFCSGVSYNLLSVAKQLSYVENLIFTRIDGDTNLLQWEYTMETFPTILFMPPVRKSESRVFPSGIPINVANLLGFILTNLDPGLKLQAMWSMCRQSLFPDERYACYSSLIAETYTYIERTLRQWRKSNERQKQILLYRLKQLRQLHLLFAHSSHKSNIIQSYFRKLNVKVDSKDYRIPVKHVKDEL